MKKKSFVGMILSVAVVLSSVLPAMADTAANYSSVIPDSLRVEMAASGYKSYWNLINSRVAPAKNLDSQSLANIKNNGGITTSAMALSWSDMKDAIRVGKMKNTFAVAPFAYSSNGNYYTLGYLGAAGIGIKNSDAKASGYSAVIAKNKLMYNEAAKKPTWGGYSTETDEDSNKNKILSGYSALPTYNTATIGVDFSSGNPYLAVGIMAEENVDLTNTYIAVWTTCVGGSSDGSDRAVTGVKLSKYYSESDKGSYKEIAIPLSDFDVANDWVASEYYHNSTTAKENAPEKPAANFGNGKIIGAGIMREYAEGQKDAENNYSVYLTKMQFLRVEAPKNAATAKIAAPDGAGYGETITFTPSAYNDVTAYEISMKDKSGNTLFDKTIPVSAFTANDDGTLSYTIGTISPQGAAYSIAAVAGETVGNEDIGYTPIKSTAITVNTKWDAGSETYNPINSMKFSKGTDGKSVNVINRCFYNCKVLVARYDSTGATLKQCDIFDPLSQIVKVTYADAIDTDKIAVFIWSDDNNATPLIEAAIVADTNVTK